MWSAGFQGLQYYFWKQQCWQTKDQGTCFCAFLYDATLSSALFLLFFFYFLLWGTPLLVCLSSFWACISWCRLPTVFSNNLFGQAFVWSQPCWFMHLLLRNHYLCLLLVLPMLSLGLSFLMSTACCFAFSRQSIAFACFMPKGQFGFPVGSPWCRRAWY